MSKSQKIRDAFAKNPETKVAVVAKKFNAPISMVYRLRKEVLAVLDVNVKSPEEVPLHIEMLDGPQDAGATWTATTDDAGDIVATLNERGSRYGKFAGHAQITQEIKRAMSRHALAMGKTFTDSQWEALEMIAHKIGRIVNGDPDYVDSWVDIAGYAKLVADELQGVQR